VTTVRLVPEKSLGRDRIQHLAARLSWILRAAYLPDDSRPFEQIYEAPDGAAVHWIVDDAIGVSYFSVEGRDVMRTVGAIHGSVEILDRRQLFERWDRGSDYAERADAIRLIGAGAPEAFDREWFEYFNSALTSEYVIVRFWAVVVAAIPGWPQLRAVVDQLARSDPDDTVRQRAAEMSAAPVWRS
jgi:hypothetical protein